MLGIAFGVFNLTKYQDTGFIMVHSVLHLNVIFHQLNKALKK